ncbi:MAG: anthranilate phosphoribosyltransferase [Methylococcaceae bacterium]|nr:anthranilate phosphoribosyltransferase [Methylococcaceae bacterium]
MKITSAINHLLDGQDLAPEAMREVMRSIMSGGATPAQIGGFLVALRAKGETVQEVVAAAEVLREMATRVPVRCDHLVDTCGTGGDGTHTFNISTAAAFVASAAGARVAKHGNRSVSSKSGSADVLEAAGVNLALTPEQVRTCIEEVGLGFLFAQHHHGAMQHAIGPRRELGIRTLFNLLGPLTNPAGAPNQVVGVYSETWVEPLAAALRELGSLHVLVVHAEDGLDEISIGAPTRLAELKQGRIEIRTLTPEQFGMKREPLSWLVVDSAEESAALIRGVLAGAEGPARDVVLLNAGAAIYAAGIAPELEAGIGLAVKALDSGAAAKKLEELITFTRQFAA